MLKTVSREELVKLIDRLLQDYKIAAPVMKEHGNKAKLEYDYLTKGDEINLQRQPDISPKKFLLPQHERMDETTPPQTIVFGVRACDISAIKVLDDVFLNDNFVDPYYQARRKNTILVGLSCTDRQESCFCDSVGINPVEDDDVPLYLYQDGERYWIRANEEYNDLVTGLPDGDEVEFKRLIEERKAAFTESSFDLNLPTPLPEMDVFSAPIWEELTEKCLGCGICTFYCSTCYCFGFTWDEEGKARNWDSCMFTTYAKHASGHNPRSGKNQRFRQRVMHKYSYHPANYGKLACTGCGRCLKNCPVNLDIRKALKKIETYLQKEEGGVSHV